MPAVTRVRLLLVVSLLCTISLTGCSSLAQWIDGPSNNTSKPAQAVSASENNSTLPADVPKDIPLLDKAKSIIALRTGDGVTPGDGFYQLSFRVASTVDQTAAQYRKILDDKHYDYVDEPVADSVSLTGNTPSWKFYLTIDKSTEVKGETTVTISYSK